MMPDLHADPADPSPPCDPGGGAFIMVGVAIHPGISADRMRITGLTPDCLELRAP